MVKSLPAMLETWVPSLGREDPLEKEMATHSSILAWRIPWTEELGRLQSLGSQESDTTERLLLSLSTCKQRTTGQQRKYHLQRCVSRAPGELREAPWS